MSGNVRIVHSGEWFTTPPKSDCVGRATLPNEMEQHIHP